MGFKAKARKHMSNDSKKEDAKSKKSNQGELSCASRAVTNLLIRVSKAVPYH